MNVKLTPAQTTALADLALATEYSYYNPGSSRKPLATLRALEKMGLAERTTGEIPVIARWKDVTGEWKEIHMIANAIWRLTSAGYALADELELLIFWDEIAEMMTIEDNQPESKRLARLYTHYVLMANWFFAQAGIQGGGGVNARRGKYLYSLAMRARNQMVFRGSYIAEAEYHRALKAGYTAITYTPDY